MCVLFFNNFRTKARGSHLFNLIFIKPVRMKNYYNSSNVAFAFVFVCLSYLLTSCGDSGPATDLATENMIPKPVSIVAAGKSFGLSVETTIATKGENTELPGLSKYLSDQLSQSVGFEISVANEDGSILLLLADDDTTLGEEGYELTIGDQQVTLKAAHPAGLFYGIQTIRQILQSREAGNEKSWFLPTGTIVDSPAYAWRGSMLDVARHFFGVEDVKRYIDLISQYKMNVLHLHLSDDQGWRIEIKSWPNLTTIGGSTQVGGGKGGFYTQEQYKEIVDYAASRYVTIVPEIDFPGHINSALASYGELNAGIIVPQEGRKQSPLTETRLIDEKNKPTELYTGIQVGWSTLHLEKEATFRFIQDVITELAEITPGPYLHIGGDEAHVTKKEDYIIFINRIHELVKSKGKKTIGWEEIAQANIDGTAIAQFWTNEEYAQLAAEKGAHIIMSPSKRVYLDMQYDSTSRIGLHWAAYIEVDEAYNWSPDTLVEGITRQNILGVEAPLWTETVETMDDIEYLVFPRLPGIAEVAWSPADGRSWDEYKVRLANHASRMKAMGVDFYPSKKVNWNE